MMFLKYIIHVLIILGSISELYSVETDLKKIQSASEYDYPPFCIVNEDGTAGGFSVELLKEACNVTSIEVTFKVDEWNTIKQELADGKLDVLPLVGRTPERESVYDFTIPYMSYHGAVFTRIDDARFTKKEDLINAKIMILKGDNAEEYSKRVKISDNIATVESFETAFRNLSEGKCDAVITQKVMGLNLLKQTKISNVKPAIDLKDFQQNFCFAVREGNKVLLDQLNEGLAVLIADGTFDRLHRQWFEPKIEFSKLKITVGCVQNFHPYEYIDESGNPAGFNVDIMRSVAKEFGILVEFKFNTRNRIRDLLYGGEIDITGMPFSKNNSKVYFSEPIVVINHSVVTRTDSEKFDRIDQLDGKSVLVTDSSYAVGYLNKYSKAIILPRKSIPEILKDLSAGTGDCALLPVLPASEMITKLNLKNLYVNKANLFDTDYCFTALKTNKYMIEHLNNGLTALKASGSYGNIYSKWFGKYEHSQINFRKIVFYASWVLGILLSVFIVVFYWNRTLAKKVSEKTSELTERESLLYGLFDNMPSGSAVYKVLNQGEKGSDYIVKFFNKRSLEIEKRNMDQVVGKSLYDLRPEIDSYGLIPVLKRVWETGIPEFFPATVYIDENFSNYYENHVFKIPGGDIVTIYDDVTDRITIQNAVGESEKKFRQIFEKSSIGIMIVGLDKKFIRCNSTFCNFLGYSEDELIGKTISDITYPDDYEIGMKELKLIVEGKMESFQTQKRYVKKDGKAVWGEINISLVRNDKKEPLFFLPVIQDITQRKEIEMNLNKTVLEIKQMNDLMVGREVRMTELKNEINELLKKSGSEPKY